jgi:hypothetical protein
MKAKTPKLTAAQKIQILDHGPRHREYPSALPLLMDISTCTCCKRVNVVMGLGRALDLLVSDLQTLNHQITPLILGAKLLLRGLQKTVKTQARR